jgi:hypothetical protein
MFTTDSSRQVPLRRNAPRSHVTAAAIAQPSDAMHVGAALIGSIVVGGGIWVALAHLFKALLL